MHNALDCSFVRWAVRGAPMAGRLVRAGHRLRLHDAHQNGRFDACRADAPRPLPRVQHLRAAPRDLRAPHRARNLAGLLLA